MKFASLPKVELHLHLDCSLSFKVVNRLNPSISYEDYLDSFVAPPKCTDLADYIKRAIRGFELMQTEEQLELVTLDLFEQLKADGVVYAEIRFAPLLHVAGGLTATEVVNAVNNAVAKGIQQTGVEGRLILCTLRHYNEAQSMETVKLVEAFSGTNVVGFDIAGDEAGFPIDAHKTSFAYAREKGLHCTAHAGEARGSDSVWETLQHFSPSRIGHGVRSAEDTQLLDFLKNKDIHLEVCATSNVQTNVYDTIHQHTLSEIYQQGVSMSINTDARTVSPVTLSSEYELLEKEFGWGLDHLFKCNVEAIRHSFADQLTKDKILKCIKLGFGRE
jgi:adenosine deaminase